MAYFLTVFFLLLSILTALLYWQLRSQRKALAEAMANLNAFEGDSPPMRDPEMVLTLKVVDPIALAKQRSRSARILADRLPFMVRKMVYQQVMTELGEELNRRGIDVDMRIEYR